ncbi:DUF4402 domain-containing protein [Vibrio scophthalmi]|uniref:DUF4402 domain-containing protein n=1 Tax=Vibrio scophthalmi TaxID=45658 RepID=A0A1C7FF79_9VIBR|nr:DUF4402 domain-containing protein [Vibrio scophthalmi]ANU38367.1 hypothetical protein VSVS05_03329 [Vibrio scophthalmi]
MKNLVKVVVASALALSAFQATASNSSTFVAELVVDKPLTVTPVAGKNTLDFGNALVGDSADLTILATDAGAVEFTLTGNQNSTVKVTAANTVVTNGSDTIDLEVTEPTTVSLDAAGDGSMKIGGILKLSTATLVAGTYSGTVNVSVIY